MTTHFWKATWAIFIKDLRAETRSRELLGVMLLFALLSVLIFSFALELDKIARKEAVSGVLWVTIVFASVLGLNRSMAQEREQGSIDALLLAPIARSAIFVGKFLGNYVFAVLVGVMLLPIMTILYNFTLITPIGIGVLLIGTWGICVVGTLLSAMTVQARGGEALLPIALLPVALPILLASVRALTGILNDSPINDWGTWLIVILMIDVFYTVVTFWVFPYVVEE